MNQKFFLRFVAISLIISVTALLRLVPHFPNFSPLGAICRFGAAHFSNKIQVYIVPLLAIWISDILVNNLIYSEYFNHFTIFYDGFYWQYGSYLLIVFFSTFTLKNQNSIKIICSAIGAALLFFLVSNFGVWASGNMYPNNFSGLMTCYIAGIPFIKGTIISNIIFSVILFGGFSLLENRYSILKPLKTID